LSDAFIFRYPLTNISDGLECNYGVAEVDAMKTKSIAILLGVLALCSLFVPAGTKVQAAINSLGITLGVFNNIAYNGATVSYHIDITNPNSVVAGTTINNGENIIVSFYPPGPNGQPVAVPSFISAPFGLTAGLSVSLPLQNVTLALNSGVTTAIAMASYSATIIGPANLPASGSANASLNIINPDTIVTINPSISTVIEGGSVGLTVTEFNSGTDDLTSPNVAVTSAPATTNPPMPLVLDKASPYFSGGDALNDGLLGSGETWSWTITGVAVTSSKTTFTANGDGIDSLGNHVNFNTVKGTSPGIAAERASTTVHTSNTTVAIVPAQNTVVAGSGTTLTVIETDTGAGPLNNPSVELTGGLVLTLDNNSPTFVSGSDPADPGVLDPGESWQWVGILTGVLSAATSFTATGHGTDSAGNDVTYPAASGEQASTTVTVNSLVVTSPQGGENWVSGSSHNINWTLASYSGSVKIELSRDSGNTWSTLAAVAPNNGLRTWTVSGPATVHARVRITSNSSPAITGVSAADFTIVQGITVTAPNGGEIWPYPGTPQNITWTAAGVTGPVKIEISRDSGTTWNTIVTPVPNNGSYAWTVHGPSTAQARIRVSSISSSAISDISDADFVIAGGLPPVITLIAPNGGEVWAKGSKQNITWTDTGFSGSVKIELSRDSGNTWSTLAALAANTGLRIWTVTAPATVHARVKVSSKNNPAVVAESAADFTIAQSITVTAPNGGETWPYPGTPQNITWTAVGVTGSVKIEISRDSGTTWNTIVTPVPNTGSYAWTVHGPSTAQARIRVSSISSSAISDTSDADFVIAGGLPPVITLIAPNGGEVWAKGSKQNITWTDTGFSGGVKIELSRDSGVTWSNIDPQAFNTGIKIWTVTAPATVHARVKVSSKNNPAVVAESAADFSIAQSITVTAPNGGETWPSGSIHNITWTAMGVTGPVKIEISRDSGTTWNTIVTPVPNNGSYSWTAHGPATTHARIRISSLSAPAISDTSDADFSI
jgi:hypothetical protein